MLIPSFFFFFFLLWGGHDGGGHGKEEEGPFQSWDLSRLHRESGPRNVSSLMVDPKGSCVLQTHPSLPILGPFSLSLALSSSFFLSSSFPPSVPSLPFSYFYLSGQHCLWNLEQFPGSLWGPLTILNYFPNVFGSKKPKPHWASHFFSFFFTVKPVCILREMWAICFWFLYT